MLWQPPVANGEISPLFYLVSFTNSYIDLALDLDLDLELNSLQPVFLMFKQSCALGTAFQLATMHCWHDFIRLFLTALLKYNSHTTQFTHLS